MDDHAPTQMNRRLQDEFATGERNPFWDATCTDGETRAEQPRIQ